MKFHSQKIKDIIMQLRVCGLHEDEAIETTKFLIRKIIFKKPSHLIYKRIDNEMGISRR